MAPALTAVVNGVIMSEREQASSLSQDENQIMAERRQKLKSIRENASLSQRFQTQPLCQGSSGKTRG
jgi:hypothetical protein